MVWVEFTCVCYKTKAKIDTSIVILNNGNRGDARGSKYIELNSSMQSRMKIIGRKCDFLEIEIERGKGKQFEQVVMCCMVTHLPDRQELPGCESRLPCSVNGGIRIIRQVIGVIMQQLQCSDLLVVVLLLNRLYLSAGTLLLQFSSGGITIFIVQYRININLQIVKLL